jgi:predicted transposase YdaD
VNFNEEKTVVEFEQQVEETFKTRKNMGIREAIIEEIKDQARQEGRQEGEKKARKEVEQKAIKTAENCLKKGLGIELTAELTELPIETVQEISRKLGQTDKQ